MKRWAALAMALALVAAGPWLSLGLDTNHIWLFGLGMIGLVGISAELFLDKTAGAEVRTHPQAFTLWSAPGLLVISALWLAQLLPSQYMLAVSGGGAVATGILLFGLAAGLNPAGGYYRLGRFMGNLVLYLAVFLLFALIYQTKERSLFTATSIGLIALVAALEILRPSSGKQTAGFRLPAVVALVIAETTWALNYWPVGGLVGGAVLLLTFYLFSGLLMAIQEGGLDRRIVLEYGVVGILGVAAISWAMP